MSPECKKCLDAIGGFHLKERGFVEMKVNDLSAGGLSPMFLCEFKSRSGLEWALARGVF